MRYQIFVPIFLIQLLNAFWYYLILRILVRTVRGKVIEDDRSEDEEDEPVTVAGTTDKKAEGKKHK
jgi:acyl-CoA-dependent ceramide synthase